MKLASLRSKPLKAAGCLAIVLLAGAPAARAGIFDIFGVVVSTITGPIGGALSSMKEMADTYQQLSQSVLYPINLINQSVNYVHTVVGGYRNWMTSVYNVRLNSAQLPSGQSLEQAFLSGNAQNAGNIGSLYKATLGSVPSASAAPLAQRQMTDMDDALAQDSLNLSMSSDQATAITLAMSQNLEDGAAASAPGTAGMLSATARAAELYSLANQHKLLAGILRVEAAELAHHNALVKQSVGQAQQLNNNMQIGAVAP